VSAAKVSETPASTGSRAVAPAPPAPGSKAPASKVSDTRAAVSDTSAATAAARPTPAPTEGQPADTPLVLDTSPGGCATGECLPEAAAPRGRDDPSRALLERWRAALDTVATESPRHSASLKQARLLSIREGEVVIAFRGDAGFHRTTVTGQSGRPVVERLLSVHFGRPTRLVLDEAAGAAAGGKTIAELDAEARAEHERATGQSVRNHPAILATLRILGGELEHIQVLEHERTGAPGSDVIDEQP
jgi:DNA polymerase III subunit tau-like protein